MDWLIAHLIGDYLIQNDWMARNKKTSTSLCLIHVISYTLVMACFTLWPPTALLIVAVTHFAQDRTQFVAWYMRVMGQTEFAKPPLAPWSCIIVDNVLHLVVLYCISISPLVRP